MKKIAIILIVCLLLIISVTPISATESHQFVSETTQPMDLVDAACAYWNVDERIISTQLVADYLSANTEFLSEIYKSLNGDNADLFNATSVELQIPVHIVTLDQDGIYLDFNENNGYMILSNINEVIVWEPAGDLAYIKDLNSTYYSLLDGFGYYIDDQFVAYEPPSSTELNEANQLLESAYDGQNSAGDGDIVDTFAYVEDRYGEGYEVLSSKSFPRFQYVHQNQFSIYYTIASDGTKYGEGNCSLSAIYALMNYLKIVGKCPSLPASTDTIKHYAGFDLFFSKYYGSDDYYIDSPKELPKLYRDIRQYAIDHYGYERSGTNPFNIPTIIESVASSYGETVDAKHIVVWTYESQVMDEISAGYPVIINVNNSSTYGSHSMVVTGYRLFVKTTTVAGIDFKDYVKLIRVNDNWTAAVRYFDFTDYYAIGSFVTVREEA